MTEISCKKILKFNKKNSHPLNKLPLIVFFHENTSTINEEGNP